MGVLSLMQPVRSGELDILDRAAGPERMKLVFPWRSLEQAGTRLIFSSGWPSPASPDPLRGIYAAVTRNGAQRVGVETALRAYTVNGAYASFEDRMKGKLKAGMLADVVILSQDIFSVPPDDIDKTKVDLTIFDGQMIYSR